MKNCSHERYEIITSYGKDRPAKIQSVKCADCGMENDKLKELFQGREDAVFVAYDGKSPYVFWGNQDYERRFKTLKNAQDLMTKNE